MIQIVEQTDEEKLAMYMKCTKKQLSEMLIQANKHLDDCTPYVTYELPKEKCDVCGYCPSTIITTQYGTFCQRHAIYV